jgi:hypothetical protein
MAETVPIAGTLIENVLLQNDEPLAEKGEFLPRRILLSGRRSPNLRIEWSGTIRGTELLQTWVRVGVPCKAGNFTANLFERTSRTTVLAE